jgi:hypothetical protein
MPKLRDVYGNSVKSGYSLDFFSLSAPGARLAMLAAPFFTTAEPIRLLTARGCEVRLLVRLCSITTPAALADALADPLVTVRYFTSPAFHAKLYIVDDCAMVGSANLTDAGLKTNREISVVLHRERDAAFEELPGLFNWFWDYADVLNQEVLQSYREAFRRIGKPKEEGDFERELGRHVPLVDPPTAKVGSDVVSSRRSFLQSLRRKYDELIIPALVEVRAAFDADGRRRPEYAGGDPGIEINRMLGWARLTHAPGDEWKRTPVADSSGRASRIGATLDAWHAASEVGAGDMLDEHHEVERISHLRREFGSSSSIAGLGYDELFDTLLACHAFLELQRFVSGGLAGLRRDFGERNALHQIKTSLIHLLHGPGSTLERAYDLIYSERWKLARFGESCVMELSGWLDPHRPPVNGRTMKALRYLGFDVPA